MKTCEADPCRGKVCSKCHFPKPLDEFVKSKNRADGRHCWCLECFSKASKVRRQNPDVKKQIKLHQVAYRNRKRTEVTVFPTTNEKVCVKCQLPKKITEFVKNYCSADGRGNWCLSCFSTYMSGKIASRQLILDTAKSKPCVDCNGLFTPCCMDFDHIRGIKYKDVSKLLTYSMSRLLEEIEKCDVVCACCHRVRSNKARVSTESPRLQEFHRQLDQIKSCPCVDCGKTFPPIAMDFDHVRGVKFRMVSTMVNYSWERVLIEVAKCDLVCANCHRIRTTSRRSVPEAA
jgi:hypothetical protein